VGAVPAAQRGLVITHGALRDFSQGELAFLLSLNGIPVTPTTGVRVRKVVYETIGPAGARTRASGVIAFPSSITQPLPLVSYQHGTLVSRADSPSTNLFGETMVGVIYASLGYAAVVPDYLGFGESPDYHPYHHAASTATACVDMLRAAKTVFAETGIPLTNRLFLCGYSQGGHATMALHRELETYHAAEFPVTSSAPMAGAYDLSGTTAADFLSGRAMPNPYYFAYLLASYQATYHLAGSLADLLTAPYATTLPPLLDGKHTAAEINAAMPSVPTRILKPDVLEAFRTNQLHALRLALRDNDAFRWTARAPIRLYHCSGDQDVSPVNSQTALGAMAAAGSRSIEFLEPSPGATHGGCSMPSLLSAKAWFDTMK
jgi:pimeloyl-ACP methyl ester carboxylesterase